MTFSYTSLNVISLFLGSDSEQGHEQIVPESYDENSFDDEDVIIIKINTWIVPCLYGNQKLIYSNQYP